MTPSEIISLVLSLNDIERRKKIEAEPEEYSDLLHCFSLADWK